MTKMKPEGWDQLSRSSKLAAVMWPDLAPKHIQAEMKSISWLGKNRSTRRQTAG
jgi:hypothetical protein